MPVAQLLNPNHQRFEEIDSLSDKPQTSNSSLRLRAGEAGSKNIKPLLRTIHSLFDTIQSFLHCHRFKPELFYILF